MGKGKKSGKKGPRPQRQDWNDIARENTSYESYYNDNGIVPKEEQEALWAALRRDLPNSFRFTGSRGHAIAVKKTLVDFHIPKITSITYEGNFVEPPKPVPWYPDQLAWYMTTPKNVVRRFPPFSSFQKFLVSEADVGNITRQEVVSMIPPLLLGVKPGMTVLDMCAAPGSKSTQLMEMLHAGEEESIRKASAEAKEGTYDASNYPEGLKDYGRSTGLLIANDSDYKRAHMLIHQMKRLNSPNLIVTNHDATMYPSLKLPTPSDGGKQNVYLKFDRILADVPCTGDGTTRKNPNIWNDWTPQNALGLHAIQLRILVRALQMLKAGGRVVYSTCSMNPIENEAVVAAAIERCGGLTQVDIVDCSKELPELKRANGLHTWKVLDRDYRAWNNWQEVKEYKEANGIGGLGRLSESMFPPAEGIPLERCLRVYPHFQDTGGFFITVLEKKSEIKAKPEDSSKVIPKASVAALVEELEQKSHNGNGDPMEKIEALDDIVPHAYTTDGQDATVAEAVHQPPYKVTLDAAPPSSSKRPSSAIEGHLPAKRTRLEDGTNAVIGDRPVHFPPPSLVEGTEDTTDYPKVEDPTQSKARVQAPSKRKPGQPQEEHFKYVDGYQDEINDIFKFYEISDQFPRDRFLVRNAVGSLSRTIYYTSELVRDVLAENQARGVKFVHGGVKMFVKQDTQHPQQCPWRIQTDGLQLLESWVGPKRIVTLHNKEILRRLLIELFPRLEQNNYQHLGEVGEQTKDMGLGCSILRVEPTGADEGFTERMVFPLWRSMYSLNLMLSKEDRKALLLRLFDDDTPVTHIQPKKGQGEDNMTMATPTSSGAEGDRDEKKALTDKSNVVTSTSDPDTANAGMSNVVPPPAGRTEEEFIKTENIVRGEEQEDLMAKRETYQRDGDEEDRFNTTV